MGFYKLLFSYKWMGCAFISVAVETKSYDAENDLINNKYLYHTVSYKHG